MPDPVGEALSILIDRIDFLEARLAHLQRGRQTAPPPICPDCDKENAP